ncbi:MAG: glycosyltransferase family 4 protein [Acidobacteria bacterium]|nr:glycosyltransferase family 4 protein [Acidobacteriota bacterium]
MRILVDYRPALRERTGVGEYIHQVATALVATAPAGEELVLFSSSWKDRVPPDALPGARIIDRRVPVRVLNTLWHRAEWPPVEWLGASAIDVCQSAHPLLMPAKRAAQAVMVHDLDFLDHPERTRAEIRRDYPALARRHAHRADRVVVVSEHTAGEVERRLGVPRSHITVCQPGTPGWRRRDREPAEGGYILFLGTLEPRKNVRVLLDAYERLLARWPAAPPLVLAGRARPDAAPLVARATAGPLAGHVELPGYVQPDRRLALYAGALVFVLPSHTEGFGLPAAEAMMAGVPVIAADRGALRESVGSAGWLVDPDDPDALAHALHTVLTDASRRRVMSDDGRRHAEQFTWERTARHLREAWQLALEHRRRRG